MFLFEFCSEEPFVTLILGLKMSMCFTSREQMWLNRFETWNSHNWLLIYLILLSLNLKFSQISHRENTRNSLSVFVMMFVCRDVIVILGSRRIIRIPLSKVVIINFIPKCVMPCSWLCSPCLCAHKQNPFSTKCSLNLKWSSSIESSFLCEQTNNTLAASGFTDKECFSLSIYGLIEF